MNFTKTAEEAKKIKKISTSFGRNFMNLFVTDTRGFTKAFVIHKKIYVFMQIKDQRQKR